MELKQYALILWRWTWLILLGLMLAGVGGYIASELTQPVYAASTTLLINQAPSGDKNSEYTALITSERLARTYAELLTKRPVLEETARTLNLTAPPESLAGLVDVSLVRDTELIVLKVEHENPALAAQLANTIPEVFSRQNEALQATRYASTKVSLEQELAALNDQIQRSQANIIAIGTPNTINEQAELTRLQNEVAQLRQSYTSLLQSYENVRLAEAQSTNTIIVVEPARQPQSPIRPRTTQNTLIAAVVGMMAAVGVAFLVEYLDDSIRSPEQVGELIGAPVMGAVAKMSANGGTGNKRALIAAQEPRSPIVEAFRTLRTNIQFAGVDRPVRTLLVTSAAPMEGKSTVSANLAVVMAQAGFRVVLMDCDLRRPSMHTIFNQPNRSGLTDMMLQASTQWDAAVQTTPIANLFILPSGSLPPNPSELLGSDRFRQFIERMSNTYDMVIIDSPPLLPVTDAAILSRAVDGVMLVVDTGATRAGALVQSKVQIERVGGHLLGVVMNKLSPGRSGSHYYYYYQYAYGSDGRRSSHKSSRPKTQPKPPLDSAPAEDASAS
jgi:non-specific protein-tyrosine kinase